MIPPLRTRREDIEPIAHILLARVGARTGRALHLSPDTLRALLHYDWPGNVRELENALEFAAIVCRGQTIQPEDLPPEGRSKATEAALSSGPNPIPGPSSEEGEGLKNALEAHRWNRGETAKALGLSRSTLWRKMRELGLARG